MKDIALVALIAISASCMAVVDLNAEARAADVTRCASWRDLTFKWHAFLVNALIIAVARSPLVTVGKVGVGLLIVYALFVPATEPNWAVNVSITTRRDTFVSNTLAFFSTRSPLVTIAAIVFCLLKWVTLSLRALETFSTVLVGFARQRITVRVPTLFIGEARSPLVTISAL